MQYSHEIPGHATKRALDVENREHHAWRRMSKNPLWLQGQNQGCGEDEGDDSQMSPQLLARSLGAWNWRR